MECQQVQQNWKKKEKSLYSNVLEMHDSTNNFCNKDV